MNNQLGSSNLSCVKGGMRRYKEIFYKSFLGVLLALIYHVTDIALDGFIDNNQ